eukprot:g9092.t1
MSDSRNNDHSTGKGYKGQRQTAKAKSGPLASLETDDVEIGVTHRIEDEEPKTGEQDNGGCLLYRRLDSSTYEQVSESVMFGGHLSEIEARRRQNLLTRPARMNTAPAHVTQVQTQQTLVPASANRVQGHPVPLERQEIPIEDVMLGGLLKCQSIDTTWLQGGSLGEMNSSEQVLVKRASRFGDCCRVNYTLSYILVTNKRFIVKKLRKIIGMNIRTEETSHHFADLQHVSVERGYKSTQVQQRVQIFAFLALCAALPLGSSESVIAFRIISLVWAIFFGIYNLVMFFIFSNINYLIIDIARANLVGSWNWRTLTKGRSYMTIRVPFHPGPVLK